MWTSKVLISVSVGLSGCQGSELYTYRSTRWVRGNGCLYKFPVQGIALTLVISCAVNDLGTYVSPLLYLFFFFFYLYLFVLILFFLNFFFFNSSLIFILFKFINIIRSRRSRLPAVVILNISPSCIPAYPSASLLCQQ